MIQPPAVGHTITHVANRPAHMPAHQEAQVLQREALRPLQVRHQPTRRRNHHVGRAAPPASSARASAAASAPTAAAAAGRCRRRRRCARGSATVVAVAVAGCGASPVVAGGVAQQKRLRLGRQRAARRDQHHVQPHRRAQRLEHLADLGVQCAMEWGRPGWGGGPGGVGWPWESAQVEWIDRNARCPSLWSLHCLHAGGPPCMWRVATRRKDARWPHATPLRSAPPPPRVSTTRPRNQSTAANRYNAYGVAAVRDACGTCGRRGPPTPPTHLCRQVTCRQHHQRTQAVHPRAAVLPAAPPPREAKAARHVGMQHGRVRVCARAGGAHACMRRMQAGQRGLAARLAAQHAQS